MGVGLQEDHQEEEGVGVGHRGEVGEEEEEEEGELVLRGVVEVEVGEEGLQGGHH